MTFPKKATRVLLSFFLILATMPADVSAGAQNASASGNQDEYAPLIPEELDSLVAPIALYPDALVAQVLGAATFPDQVTAIWRRISHGPRRLVKPPLPSSRTSWLPCKECEQKLTRRAT